MSFVHLHCHSNYSLLTGASSVGDLLARAKELGMRHLALTDTNNLYGAFAFCKAAEEVGIEPIVGAQVEFLDGDVVLLVVDEEGYGNLCEILTRHHVDGPQNSCESLTEYHRGLIALAQDVEQVGRLMEVVPDGNLYLEVRDVSRRGGASTAPTNPKSNLHHRFQQSHAISVRIGRFVNRPYTMCGICLVWRRGRSSLHVLTIMMCIVS